MFNADFCFNNFHGNIHVKVLDGSYRDCIKTPMYAFVYNFVYPLWCNIIV